MRRVEVTVLPRPLALFMSRMIWRRVMPVMPRVRDSRLERARLPRATAMILPPRRYAGE